MTSWPEGLDLHRKA